MKLLAGVVLACVAMAAAASVAAAQPDAWQRVGRAPGGDSFAVIGGTPYVAKKTSAGVRVWRFKSKGKWTKVGARVRHSRHDGVAGPSLVAGPHGVPWLTWSEGTGAGNQQIRVARFAKGKWREVVGGKDPISPTRPSETGDGTKVPSSSAPTLAFLQGRPYVAFENFDGIDSSIVVSRLSSNGKRWQQVGDRVGGTSVTSPTLVRVGARLYLAAVNRVYSGPVFARSSSSGASWEDVTHPQSTDSASYGGIVGFGGRLHTLFAEQPTGDVFVSSLDPDGQWSHVGPHIAQDPAITPQSIATDGTTLYAAYVQRVDGAPHVDSFFFDGSAWQRFPSPTRSGSSADSAKLAGAAGGGVWLLAREVTGGKATFQLELFNAAG